MDSTRQLDERSDEARWLRSLRDLVQEWVKANDGLRGWVEQRGKRKKRPIVIPVPVPTDAYVDLIFAFGLARLGAHDESRELLNQAESVLPNSGDVVHSFVYRAFAYRITEALAGKPHAGLLAAELIDELGRLYFFDRYLVDRLRKHSRILEPHQRVDPYGLWSTRINNVALSLHQLTDLSDRREIAERVRKLLTQASAQKAMPETRAEILCEALEISLRMDEKFASQMLDTALSAYDALPTSETVSHKERGLALSFRVGLLEKSLATVNFYNFREFLAPMVDRIQALLNIQTMPELVFRPLDALVAQYLLSLRKWGRRDEVDQLLTRLADLILMGKDTEEFVRTFKFGTDPGSPTSTSLKVLLQLAGWWYYLGRNHDADHVLQNVRSVWFQAEIKPIYKSSLVCAYARAMSYAPTIQARKGLEEIFRTLKGVYDLFTSQSHFKAIMLEMIESVVLVVVERSQALTQ
jgi:hypothetical protein